MEDITPKLLEQIQKEFQSNFAKNEKISRLYAKIEKKTASYKEANDFAIEVGEILADAYRDNLSSGVLPDGKMYYNIARRILNPTMENNYNLINDVTARVLQALNEAANIGIRPIKPDLPRDRINGIIDRVSSEDTFDDIAWILDEPIKIFSQSIVDDAIRVNAEFHAAAGMRPRIIRKLTGGCCEWCSKLAGTYTYPDVPQDVYRRHQRCRCTVDYIPGDGKVQNSHTKQWRDASKDEILAIVRNQGLGRYDTAVTNEPEITDKIKEVAKNTGLDTYGIENRIKSRQRYAEKLEKKLAEGKSEVNDILRYTLGTEESTELVGKMNAAIEKFADSGYNTVVLKNTWNDKKNPYKGINSTVVAPNNQKFEVQYHTKESYTTKEEMHRMYEKARLLEDKESEEAIALREEMFRLSETLTPPKDIERVESYGKQI